MEVKVLGADIGSRNTKLHWGDGFYVFDSTVCDSFELNMYTATIRDMIVEFKGSEYFVGDLAVREADFPLAPKGINKVRELTLLRLLSGLAKNNIDRVEKLAISQPIVSCTKEYGDRMRELIVGTHTIVFNGEVRSITIERVLVIPEGVAAYYSLDQRPIDCNIIDFGSGTINLAVFRSRSVINRLSSTQDSGAETNNQPMDTVAKFIFNKVQASWNLELETLVVGGMASKLTEKLLPYFPNARMIKEPIRANAIGLYNVAVRTR